MEIIIFILTDVFDTLLNLFIYQKQVASKELPIAIIKINWMQLDFYPRVLLYSIVPFGSKVRLNGSTKKKLYLP